MTISIQDLLGKRCLLKVSNGRWNNQNVDEYRVLEISPSGTFTKIMNIYGNKYWKPTSEISFVEELIDIKAERKKETGEDA